MTDRENAVFSVWAPEKNDMVLHLAGSGKDRKVPMQKDERGYFSVSVQGVAAGDTYFFMPDGTRDLPDPTSHFQPEGVHGPSGVVDHHQYVWQDIAWKGLPFRDLIFYELHVGTFSKEGTFDSVIPRLDDLVALGVNAIELMPVNQFPGERNWGYDGTFLYAVQHSYGGPEGLKRLVDACHARGLAVCLDVVYNHIGPEGDYLDRFGPYFTPNYHTPWGEALNVDGPWSDGVREFIIGNVLHWFTHYHFDALRIDAIHEVYDRNAIPIWEDLRERVRILEQGSGRPLYLIAESDLNSPRVIRSPEMGGFGFDAQWLDDFHHALYVFLEPEAIDHYQDFGRMDQLAKALKEGFVHSGDYVRFRKRKHGASSAGIPGDRFVVFNQNHDLPGNRPDGKRLSALVDFERLKLAAGILLLSPYVPLLFMGEEYGETAPFFFFSDYGESNVVEGLKEGRKQQFAGWGWSAEPPDAQDPSIFRQCKLNWDRRREGKHAVLLEWYKELIALRKADLLIKDLSKDNFRVDPIGQKGLAVSRCSRDGGRHLLCLYNLSDQDLSYALPAAGGEGWARLLDSGDTRWKVTEGTKTGGSKTEGAETGGAESRRIIKNQGEVSLLPVSVLVLGSTTGDRYAAIQ